MFTRNADGKELATVIRVVVEFHEGVSPLTFELGVLLRGESSELSASGVQSLSRDIIEVIDDYEKTATVVVPRKTRSASV